MAGFSSYDDLINEMTTNGKALSWDYTKTGPVAEAAGQWASLWYAAGSPGAGADPAATPGTAYDDTAGSMFFTDQSPDQKHLVTFGGAASVNCSVMLYDRLVGVSGISVASTGNKTINSTALPRYSGTAAAVVSAWVEVTTATTTTAVVMSMNSYTNQAGTAGRAGATITFPAVATDVRWMANLPLQAGDQGVRSIEVGVNVATAAAAGVINVLLLRELAVIPMLANIWNERDLVLQLAAMPRVFDGGSLALAQLATATTATNHWGTVRLAYG
jgi:hypothetical protein